MKIIQTKTLFASLTVAAAAVSGSADAAVLYQFSTTQSAGGYDPSLVTTTVAANVTAPNGGTELDDGVVGLDRFDNAEWDGFTLGMQSGKTTIDNAGDFSTRYFELTVSAEAGYTLDLDSLSFNSARGGSSGTRGFEIYTAVDGGAFTFGDTPILDVADETGTRSNPRAVSIDLTGAEYQGISSITFRYYALTNSPGSFVRSIDFDGWTLEGDAVIPEPGSLALLGLGGICMLRRRRA